MSIACARMARMRIHTKTCICALSVAWVLLAATADANVPDLYGFGPRFPAMGGAATAIAEGFGAVYYNPAGLSRIDTVDAGVGFLYTSFSFSSIRNVVIGTDPADPSRRLTGNIDFDLSDSFGMWAGFGVSLSRRLSVGMGLFLPSSRYLAELKSQSQREPHYLRFEDRPDRLVLLAAVALDLPAHISLGAGANVLFGPEGHIGLSLVPFGESRADLTLVFRPRISPIAGIQYQPLPPLRLGVTYRGELTQGELDVRLDGQLYLGFLSLPILGQVSSMIFFAPQQVSAGIAYDPIRPLTLALEVAWKDWSRFRDASLKVDTPTGGASASNPILRFEEVFPPDFHDTVVARVGGEYRLGPFHPAKRLGDLHLDIRAGYSYEPTPVPEQTGLTNFLDQDRHVFATGFGVRADNPFGLDKSVWLDALFQFHFLQGGTVRKARAWQDLDGDGTAETPVIGYPGYEISGEVFAAGLTLGIDF